jgi:LPS sulfotransferase NodH
MYELDYRPPGVHELRLQDYFGEEAFAQPGARLPNPVTIMLFVNRCGSTLLGEYLRASGCFSGFGEPLSHELVIKRCETHGLKSLSAYIQWLLENIRQPDTQFGMKLSLDQVEMLLRAGVLPQMLPRVNWVYIYRRDILGQAISFSIAAQTGAWKSSDSGAERNVAFDYADIEARVEEIALRYYNINRFLALSGINAYQLAYEEFLLDPTRHSLDIARACGGPAQAIDHTRLSMQRQSSGLNQQFREQFLAVQEREAALD